MVTATATAAKTFYHRIPGSTYIDASGITHQFLGGQLTTSDSVLQAELEALCKGTAIVSAAPFTTTVEATKVSKEAASIAGDVAAKAAAAALLAANASKQPV